MNRQKMGLSKRLSDAGFTTEREYYPSGNLWKKTIFLKGKKHVEYIYDDVDNPMSEIELIPWADNVIHGNRIKYYSHTMMEKETEYVMGEKKREVTYYPDKYGQSTGYMKSLTYFNNNRVNGIIKGYYPQLKLFYLEEYNIGIPIGEHKKFYESGNVKKRCFYIDGKLNGEYRIFYDTDDERLKEYRTYINGELNGELMEYSITGDILRIRYYDNDLLVDNE